jgi:hypothetical protein
MCTMQPSDAMTVAVEDVVPATVTSIDSPLSVYKMPRSSTDTVAPESMRRALVIVVTPSSASAVSIV